MTRQVITIAIDAPIVDAANSMLLNHISGLPVVDEAGRLVGIISQGDFIRRAEIGTQRKRGRWLKFLVGPGRAASDFVHERGRKVGEIMTSEPYTVTEDATLEDIVELMERNNVKRLPVLRGSQLVGIVTRSNLLQAVAGLIGGSATRRQAPGAHALISIIRKPFPSGSRNVTTRMPSPRSTGS